MINFNYNGIKNSFAQFNILNVIFLSRRNHVQLEKEKPLNIEKLHMIGFYSTLCMFPDFEIKNPTMNRVLIDPFYDAAIKLTYDFEFTEQQFEYYRSNFNAYHVTDKLGLISFLMEQKLNPQRHDSRYMMGFRSFYAVLRNNIDQIEFEYLIDLNNSLSVFFNSFQHKEMFIPGLEYVEK